MSRVLVVGNLTLDIVHSVEQYPAEDAEVRAHTQRFQRGGNGANTVQVLAQHGHRISFVGTLADDVFGRQLAEEMTQIGIDMQYCQLVEHSHCPLSCVTHSQQTGSRTIVHYRDLAEYPAEAFAKIPLTEYDWFHFEGRNLGQLALMLEQVQQVRLDQPISLEIEKARPSIEPLFVHADVLLFARAYAHARQIDSATQLFDWIRQQGYDGELICGWGEQGAYARTRHGDDMHVPAQDIDRICDSVGAGDTFNAGVIHSLLGGKPLAAALDYANALAAKKLQQIGFENLVE